MSAEDKFLQFPLCALSMAGDAEELLEGIIRFGMVEAGRARLNTLDKDDRLAACKAFRISAAKASSWDLAARLGAKICDIISGDFDGVLAGHAKIQNHLARWKLVHGPDPFIRIRKGICFDVRDGKTLSLREFRVLAAIYSSLGRKMYAAIGFRMIGARYIGCKSQAVADAEIDADRLLPEPLTQKQLRGTVTRLHELQWFARVTPSRHGRVTYYSNRMSQTALREKIFTKRTFSKAFNDEQHLLDDELAKRIEQKKGTFNREEKRAPLIDDSEPVISEPESRPLFGHRKGTAEAPEGHREGTFNINPLNTNPCNINPPDRNPMRDSAPTGETGYLIRGRFITTAEANKLVSDNPDQLNALAKEAKRAIRNGKDIVEVGA